MSNFSNDDIIELSAAKDTIPLSSAQTGTVDSEGIIVRGTATLFMTELKVGDYIFDAAQNEIRKVKAITDNTSLVLWNAFSVNMAAVALVTTPASRITSLSIGVPPGSALAASIYNNAGTATTLRIGTAKSWSKTSENKGVNTYVDPKIVDATGTDVEATIVSN